MIPSVITKGHIDEAIRRIERNGIPSRRRGRGYCLVTDGKHLPPKYTIALAHQVATGEFLHSDRFNGGAESNNYLRCRGFAVVECGCGGSVEVGARVTPVTVPPERGSSSATSALHSERCSECKIRVRELLKRIYGTCLSNHRFGWQTGLAPYAETSIGAALRDVAAALHKYRGFTTSDFVRRDVLAGCDYWVPNPGFIVEFDESQHFTSPRKLTLTEYANEEHLGFSAKRWITLCEQHDSKDNDPPFRDEQRAWYDTLRDLLPSVKGLGPTVRLYARDRNWCSLDPDNAEDREDFSDLMRQRRPPLRRTAVAIRSSAVRRKPKMRVAMVFPEASLGSENGVPPTGGRAQQPLVPTTASFAGEAIDFVLFPEGYICASDDGRKRSLQNLASELDAPLLVGAIERNLYGTDRACQVLLRFESDGSLPSRAYVKHSTAKAVAFERHDWEACEALPIFDLGGVTAGATICHDHYLGLLPRFLAKQGAQLWVNPSYDNVTEIKWSSILRLRAVENRFFALCTLHRDVNDRRETHPFGFSPDGSELSARRAGSDVLRPLSECRKSGSIYVVELDMSAVHEPLDWSVLPLAETPQPPRNSTSRKSVRIALRGGMPAVLTCSGWKANDTKLQIETEHGKVYVGVVPENRILDAAACFSVLDQAKQMNSKPIIWNHWNRVPADSARLATLMMGRAIECCSPIVISDRGGICELVELSNRNKIPHRRTIESSGIATVDIRYSWGLKSAFKMVEKNLPREMRLEALNRYRSLR